MSNIVEAKDAPGVLRSIGITPGKKYRFEDFRRLLTKAKADKLKVRGYVLRIDMEGYISVVHVSQTDFFQDTMKDEWRKVKDTDMLTAAGRQPTKADYDNPVAAGSIKPIIKKRTPQQRLDSLMQRWVDDCLRTGKVPGLDDPMISVILDNAFQAGKTTITAENVRTVARYFLEDAERKKNLADHKKVVKPSHGS